MKKQYMDFVPTKSAKSTVKGGAGKATGGRVASSKAAGAGSAVTAKPAVRARATAAGVRGAASSVAKTGSKPMRKASATRPVETVAESMYESTYEDVPGVMSFEELAAEVRANRIGGKVAGTTGVAGATGVVSATGVATTAAVAKSKRIGGRAAKKAASKEKVASKVEFEAEKKEAKKSAYQVPRPSFINQNRVVKRPLSKNVYQKKVETPVEEPKGPVTIISKPEKNSKVGLIVTIILTVILGAAAGTVAFLLLPK